MARLEIKARLEAATPGPWKWKKAPLRPEEDMDFDDTVGWDGSGYPNGRLAKRRGDVLGPISGIEDGYNNGIPGLSIPVKDAIFIENAVEDMRYLLGQLVDLLKQNEELQEDKRRLRHAVMELRALLGTRLS